MTDTLPTDLASGPTIDAAARDLIFGAAQAAPHKIINLHALHAVAPSLLNRDNLGAQKTITHGGVVRVRVSSQCWKRAMRTWIREQSIAGGAFAVRSNRWPAAVAEVLTTQHAVDSDVANAKAVAVFKALGFKISDRGTTAAQIFAHQDTAIQMAEVVAANIDQIADTVPSGVVDSARVALSVANAVDLALLGRMLAEQPVGGQIIGGLSVDHASSVDPAAIVEDFFTAVDDLTPEGEAVSGNLGVSDLSAPVFYRTASIDVDQVRRNLAAATDPDALTAATVAVMIEAFVTAVPSAKQHSSNVGTRPSLLVASTGSARLTAHNAFTEAIRGEHVVRDATTALFDVLAFQDRFGSPQTRIALAGDSAAEQAIPAGTTTVTSLQDLIDAVTK